MQIYKLSERVKRH